MTAAAAPFFAEAADAPDGAVLRWLICTDGVRIRAALWRGGTMGTVLLVPGRTEYIEKYGPAAGEMAARGYSMVTVDWRGQGLADRPLADRASVGQRYDLGGPRVLSLAEIVEYVAHLRGLRRRIFHLGPGLSKLQAHLMEYIPGKPFSLDNLRSMQTDSVCLHGNGLEILRITPTPMEAVAPAWLVQYRPHGRFATTTKPAA